MMNENPLISVVIPTYFRNDLLREALKSMYNQTYSNIEIIVVDGSGEEHAQPVADEYDEVHYIAQDQDEGAHAARSEGAESASGDYINFLDDDDRFHPEKLERQLPILESETDIGVVYCGKRDPGGQLMLPDPDIRGDVIEYALRFHMTPANPSTMLIDRDVLDDMLPLKNQHGADDMGMKIELAKRTQFDFVDEALVTIGTADDSLGGSRENIEGRFQLLDQYSDLYDKFPSAVRRDALAHSYLLDAHLRLNEHLWSPLAIYSALRACYYVPGLPSSFVGYLGASLLGRPGRDIAANVYHRFLIGDENRGKLT